MKATFAAVVGALFVVLQVASATETVKFTPFGASIVGITCWRAYLWKKLQDAGYTNVDFTGTLNAPDCGFPYDADNEGHAGYLATDIVKDNLLPAWLAKDTPDIILVHLGTNDIVQQKSTDTILQAYSTLIDQMRAQKPTIHILFSKLIPIDNNKFKGINALQRIIDLNAGIDRWAPTKNSTESPIIVLDPFTGFNTTTETADGEHPNTKGSQDLADRFFPAVVNGIKCVTS